MIDSDLLNEACYHLLENSGDANLAFSTAMFTTAQFINALNDRQRRFQKDTGCVLKRNPNIGGTPGTSRYALPTDWIETERLTWTPQAGKTYALISSDAFELDHGMSNWESTPGNPLAYHDSTLPTLTVEMAPAPAASGTLGIVYVQQPTALDGTGVAMTIPDEFSPSVKWGALADLLGQDAEGNDPERAQYCQMRYDMGVEMSRLLTEGPNA